MSENSNKRKNKSSTLSIIKSVGSAFIGVQSNKNRERDFAEGKPSHFIIVGIIAVIIFIGTLITVVSLVLPS